MSALIRELNEGSESEVDLVAKRMRLTLIEVLGEERGKALYTLDWLRDRVRWHLDPDSCTGKVFLAVSAGGEIVGHTIVRVDEDRPGDSSGLFSTIYVAPESRGQGIAADLVLHGEHWLKTQGMKEGATNTAEWNARLIRLFERRGYQITDRYPESRMVRLAKSLV